MEKVKKFFKASLLVLFSLLIIAQIFLLVKDRIYKYNTIEAALTFEEPATELESAKIFDIPYTDETADTSDTSDVTNVIDTTEVIYIETPSGIEIISPTTETEKITHCFCFYFYIYQR